MRRPLVFIALCLLPGLVFSYVLAVSLAFARLGDERELFPRFFKLDGWHGAYKARAHFGYEFGRIEDERGVHSNYGTIEIARAYSRRADRPPAHAPDGYPATRAPEGVKAWRWNEEHIAAAGWPRHCVRGSLLPVPFSLRGSSDTEIAPVAHGALRRPGASDDLHGSSVIPLTPMPAGLAINTLFWGGILAAMGLTLRSVRATRRRRCG